MEGNTKSALRRVEPVLFCLFLILPAVSAPAATVEGPVVAVRDFTATGPGSVLGKGLPDMLITDLVQVTEPCTLKVAEWRHRSEVIQEIERQQTSAFDPASAVTPGRMEQPDVFVDGSMTTTDSTDIWSITISDAMTGEVLATEQASAPADQIFEAEQALVKRLAQELCKARPGYQIAGTMDEATINGIICGKLNKPFVATSPEVVGSWTFTPANERGGQFAYAAQNVGGATGSGSGTYRILPGEGGAKSIKLSGSGAVHSPLGTFSAPITESLTLTPIATCRRTGNR